MFRAMFLLIALSFLILKCGYHAPPEYERIFDLPPDQRAKEFQRLPLEKQIEMYRYAAFREPPAIGYEFLLAKNGEVIIPYLMKSLEDEKSESFKVELIRVFKVMQEKYCDLRNRDDVIDKLRKINDQINDSDYRREGENLIQFIKK